jgi:DNA-binding transcriptional LysR family regulator
MEDAELWRELGLAYRRDRTLPRATTAFIAVLKEMAAKAKKA